MMAQIPNSVLHVEAFRPLLDMLDSVYMTAPELAARWRYTDDHLSNLRRSGKGPAYVRLPDSGRVLYSVSAVIAHELAGSARVTTDHVALALASCPGLTNEQRAAAIAHVRDAIRPGKG